MAKRLDITSVIGKPIDGSYLTITGAAGVDKHHHRLVTVHCSRCGSVGHAMRLSQVLGAKVRTCGCAEAEAFEAFMARKIARMRPAQVEKVWEAVESGHSNADGSVARQISKSDPYLAHYVWRAFARKLAALPAQLKRTIHAAAQRMGRKAESFAGLAHRFHPPVL